jgi:hypothetical protein
MGSAKGRSFVLPNNDTVYFVIVCFCHPPMAEWQVALLQVVGAGRICGWLQPLHYYCLAVLRDNRARFYCQYLKGLYIGTRISNFQEKIMMWHRP